MLIMITPVIITGPNVKTNATHEASKSQNSKLQNSSHGLPNIQGRLNWEDDLSGTRNIGEIDEEFV